MLVSPDKKTQDFERIAADKKLSIVPSTAGALSPPLQLQQQQIQTHMMLGGLDDEMKLLIMQLCVRCVSDLAGLKHSGGSRDSLAFDFQRLHKTSCRGWDV